MFRRLKWRHGAAAGLVALLTATGINVYVGSNTIPTTGQSCPAFPSFPDASCTGVPADTTLTAYTGPTNITVNGTVIDSKDISSCITISATNVTIKNSYIHCSGSVVCSGGSNCDDGTPGGDLLIQDSEIDCEVTTGTGIGSADFHLLRVEVHRCENGCDINRNVLIEDSWIHDQASVGADPHEDGCQFAAGHFEGGSIVNGTKNTTIQHSTIDGAIIGGGQGTSAIIMNGGQGLDQDVLFQHNWFKNGGTTIYCPRPGTGTNVQILDNHFTVAINIDDDCADETHSGNVYHATGLPADPDFSG